MPNLYFIPGILSSELFTDPAKTDLLWVSYTQLAYGRIGKLRLAADGVSPGAPDGVPCYAGAPLPDYYSLCLALLRDHLAPQGYDVIPWGYDWRLDELALGVQLANRIRQENIAEGPCTIVGHSNGGLVARSAWYDLVRTEQTNLVRRIVTLGTPHRGSYSVAMLFSLEHSFLSQASAITWALAATAGISAGPFNGRYWSQLELCQLAATWPALYQLLPLVDSQSEVNDPARVQLYDAARWPAEHQVSAAWLADVRARIDPFILSPDSLPPSHVLTTVAGYGYPTPDGLIRPAMLGSPNAIGSTNDGDNSVTVDSALIPESARVSLISPHESLPANAVMYANLAGLVTAIRSPVDPVPPAATSTGTPGTSVGGPPVPNGAFGQSVGRSPAGSGCCGRC